MRAAVGARRPERSLRLTHGEEGDEAQGNVGLLRRSFNARLVYHDYTNVTFNADGKSTATRIYTLLKATKLRKPRRRPYEPNNDHVKTTATLLAGTKERLASVSDVSRSLFRHRRLLRKVSRRKYVVLLNISIIKSTFRKSLSGGGRRDSSSGITRRIPRGGGGRQVSSLRTCEIHGGRESRRVEGRRRRERGAGGRDERAGEGSGREGPGERVGAKGSGTSAASSGKGRRRASVSSTLLTHFPDDVTLTETFTWEGGGRGRYGRHRVPGGTRNGAGTRRKIASRERGVSEELFCLQDAASHPKIVRLPTTAVVSERLHDWRCEGGRHGDNPDYEAPSTARLHITKWPLFICVLSASPPKHTEQVRGRRNKGGDEREDRERERMVRRDR